MRRHLTKEDRKTIDYCLKCSWTFTEIGKRIQRSKTVISREVKRNGGRAKYRHGAAHIRYLALRREAKNYQRKLTPDSELSGLVEKYLKKLHSPEQVAGRIRVDFCLVISHDTIYTWIYEFRPDLKKYLRCQKGQWRKKRGTKKREKRRRMTQFKCIDTRPKIIETRTRLGDWEGDTVICKTKKNRILTYVDRTSGYACAAVLHKVSAEIVQEMTKELFKRIPKSKRKTITFDRGSEFGGDDSIIEQFTSTTVYRAHAYHSWERGTNENWNGLLRQFFPKGSDFTTINQKNISSVVRLINHRPRKRLNFLTPHEVFVLGLDPKVASHVRM